jgi:hypothetical protein
MGKGPWKPGQSGNPAGRPPKGRALTEILENAGNQTVDVDGKKISGKRLVARLLWDIATLGRVTLPDGREWIAQPESWLEIVRFIYAQVDGGPKATTELTGLDGGPVLLQVMERIVTSRNVDDGTASSAGELPG